MLSLFRTNQISFNFFILINLFILRIPSFYFPLKWEPLAQGILQKWIYDAFGTEGVLINTVTLLIIFAQAFLLNELSFKHRLLKEMNLFPGLFFGTICCCIPGFLVPSPLHFANLFLLIALSELLHTYRSSEGADKIFNVGFWIGVASLCYFSYAIFVLLAFFGLNLMRALKFREILMIFSGFLVPFILLGTYMFAKDDLAAFLDIQFYSNLGRLRLEGTSDFYSAVGLIGFSMLILVTILSYPVYIARKKRQEQRKIQVFYWVYLLTLPTLFLQADIKLEHLLILALPIGLFLSMNFSRLKKGWSDGIHLLLFAGILLLQYREFFLSILKNF